MLKTYRALASWAVSPIRAVIFRRNYATEPSTIAHQPANRQPFLDSLYSDEERKLLLNVFNKWTGEELLRVKGLSKKRVECLEKYRADNGVHQTLANVSKVSGITVLALQKMCKLILEHRALKRQPPIKDVAAATQCHPPVPPELCQAAEHVTSLGFSADRIYWCQLSKTSHLIDWNSKSLWDKKVAPRVDYIAYAEAISAAVAGLPESTIYVIEKNPPKFLKGYCTPSALVTSLVGTVAVAMLNSLSGKVVRPHVSALPSQKVAHLFELNVGNERISSQPITHELMYAGCRGGINIAVPASLRELYLQQNNSTKECMSNCLLQAVAFMELVVKPLSASHSETKVHHTNEHEKGTSSMSEVASV